MKVSHRVQSTVDGFDFNSKLTDSVECSLKQPETQNSADVTVSVCKYQKGLGDRNNRVALVVHFVLFKPFQKNKNEEV